MKHVRLLVLTEDLPRTSLALAETEAFHADERPPEPQALSDQPGRPYREVYAQARARFDKIARMLAIPAQAEIDEVRVIPLDELSALNDWLGEIWEECSGYEEVLRRLDDDERLIHEQYNALANFANLNIDLGMLRTKTRFLDFYVGIVPNENRRQLEGAVELAGHLLFTFMETSENAHVVIVGPSGAKEDQLSSVLSAASFQHLPIPEELDRLPGEKRAELGEREETIANERARVERELETWAAGLMARLVSARRVLLLAEPFVTLDPSIRSTGALAHLAGWVPARAVATIERRLEEALDRPFNLTSRNPTPDERKLVPTVPVRSRLLAPFALLVKQYGIPQYGEADPTPLFAITFLLMFGTMFGDVGQGAVIALAAWGFRRKLGRLALFGVFAGLSSMCFGFVFGSVFGFEHVLPALWMSPLEDPILMLSLALAWGVVFIVLACGLAIFNRLVIGNLNGAVFGPHGVVNLAFYLALVWGGMGMAQDGRFGTLPTLITVFALAALAVHSWRHLDAPLAEKMLVVFIETLETVIGYISNTLSFLRVAAFSLNHVALSIAVFTLAGMMQGTGQLITIVLGNLFVLVLEGGIVLIQVMRLQYYEGFSRYFSGDGHEFMPLRLRRDSTTAEKA